MSCPEQPAPEASYRTLIFALAFPPAAVGPALYAHRLARGFAEKGSAVLVLAPQAGAGGVDFDRGQPYRTVRMPAPSLVPLRYLQARRWLRRALREFRPDSLWTTNGMTTRVVGLLGARERAGVPVVSCMRGSDLVTRLPGAGLWARLESLPQRRCYNNSAAIAAASAYIRQIAIHKGIDGDRIFINPSGFDFGQLDGYRYNPGRLLARYAFLRDRKVTLTVARLVAQKRIDVTIRAVARLVGQIPDLCHVVVGDGPQRRELGLLVDELGLANHVFLVGPVPPMTTELYDLYSAAQTFVMTSVREGMANVFMEAGAFELPSIGVADGSTPEIVRDGETGLLARPDDADDIAAKLGQVLLDRDLARRLGAGAREWIGERFTAQAMVDRSFRVLQDVVLSTTPPVGTGGAA